MDNNEKNNGNGQQPPETPPVQQEQPPVQPEQPPVQQQPYQQQPYQQQPYQQQPYQQQPYQQQPYQPFDGTVVGGHMAGKPKRKLTWLWILLGVIVALGIAAIVLWQVGVFDAGVSRVIRQGNQGVWAAYDFIDGQMEKQKELTPPAQVELGERMIKEPFEVDGEVEIEMDQLQQLGMPMDSISLDFEAKYDLEDLGVKLSFMGMIDLGAYLIEDEVVIEAMGSAASVPIELPIEADLSKAMPLEDRVKAFLPFLPDDNDMAMELFTLFAVSVPDEMTRVDNDWVYSPQGKEKVEANAIHTEIDKEGIKTVAENFLGGLQENEELLGDVQAMANEFTAFFGLDDVDLGDEIAGIDLSEIENADFSEIEWTVYEYEGEYIGISFGVDADEVDMQIIYMSEFRDDEINYSTQILIDGEETQTTTGSVRGDGERMLFDMESSMTQQISMDGDETTTEMEVSGEIMAKQTGKDNYDLTMDYDLIMEMDMGDMGLGMVEMPDEMEIGLSIEADCALGSELESMRDSRDWNDIYDMDWGDIDGLMQGLFGITGMMM